MNYDEMTTEELQMEMEIVASLATSPDVSDAWRPALANNVAAIEQVIEDRS